MLFIFASNKFTSRCGIQEGFGDGPDGLDDGPDGLGPIGMGGESDGEHAGGSATGGLT